MYYDGMTVHGARDEDPTWYTIILQLVIDAAISLLPSILLVARRMQCVISTDDTNLWSGIAPMYWYYPSVPGAVLGLWITADAFLFRIQYRGYSLTIIFLLLLLVGVGLFVPTLLDNGNLTSAVPIFAYLYMGMPGVVMAANPYFAWLNLLCLSFAVILSVMARTFGIAFSALTMSLYDLPFHLGGSIVFGTVYLAVGVVCSLFAVWGLRMKNGPRDVMRDMTSKLLARAEANGVSYGKQERVEMRAAREAYVQQKKARSVVERRQDPEAMTP